MAVLKSSSYFANVQALRGVAALSVLLCHIIKFGNQKYHLGYPALGWWSDFFAGGVDLFFVISGFIIYTTTQKDQMSSARLAATWHFLRRRFLRIYPIYWFMSALLVPLLLLRPGWINSGGEGGVSLLPSFLLFPHQGVPLLMVAWTLEYEMVFYVVFAGLLALGRRFILPGLTLWALSGWGIGMLYGEAEDGLGRILTSPFLLEFMAGCWVAWGWRRGKVSSLVLGVLAIWALVFLAATPFLLQSTEAARVAYFFGPVLFFLYGGVVLERYNGITAPAWMQSLGDVSYALYLVHVPAISAVGRAWYGIGLDAYLPVEGLALLMAVVTVLASYGLHYVVERPLAGWLKRRQGAGRIVCPEGAA